MVGLLRAFWTTFEDRVSTAECGMRLLRDNLTSSQLAQYEERRCFDVIGGETGRCYCVHLGDSMNVDELDADGRCINKLCFQPEGSLVKGDVLLAQKIALELYERDVLAVANKYPFRPRRAPVTARASAASLGHSYRSIRMPKSMPAWRSKKIPARSMSEGAIMARPRVIRSHNTVSTLTFRGSASICRYGFLHCRVDLGHRVAVLEGEAEPRGEKLRSN